MVTPRARVASGCEGQALLELSVSAGLAGLALGAVALLLRGGWDRAQCSYLVFETAHARLVGTEPPRTALRVRTREDDVGVSAAARCGGARESVALPRLERARW